MKVLELQGRFFRVPDQYETKDELMKQPADEVILEEIGREKLMEEAQPGREA